MNEETYNEAIEALRPNLLRAALSYNLEVEDAKDVVQDAVAYCYAHLSEYREDAASFTTWVTKRVITFACNFLRDQKLRQPPCEVENFDPLVEDPGTHRRAQRKPASTPEPSFMTHVDKAIDLKRALLSLSDRTRAAVWACVVEGWTYKEYGEKIGVSGTRVQQIVERGIKLMKDYLELDDKAYRREKLIELFKAA
jgi:RNA polymerase sigma factor (sigma-70 family)